MSTPDRERLLAGLVSEQADALYARLVRAGDLKIGTGADEIDLESAAARELFDRHLAWRSTAHRDRVVPVSEVQALQLLLAYHHQAMVQRQQTIMRGWAQLDSYLPTAIEPEDVESAKADSLVEVLTDGMTIRKLSAEIYKSARKELLGLSIGAMSMPMDDIQLITPPEPSLNRGTRFRMIYDATFAANAAGSRIIGPQWPPARKPGSDPTSL